MSEFISVNTLAVDSAQTTANSIDFKAELTTLDTVFADGALIKFEYGTNSDLSASTHNHEDDRGLFALGQVTSQITGLTADTQYYYKAVGETVSFNSDTSMNNAVQSSGFMSDLAENETKINEVINSFFTMDKITSNSISMDVMLQQLQKGYPGIKFFNSNYLFDTLWDKGLSSELFWNKCDVYNGAISSDVPLGSGYSFNYSGDISENKKMIELIVDFTEINNFKIYTKETENDWVAQYIKIGTNNVYQSGQQNAHTWTERNFDVSSITGEKTIEIGINDIHTSAPPYNVNFYISHLKFEA